ncbi:substrate-binding domain-containing protein [Paracraurococcus ruber]|uniref:Molybdate transport system substrate-binding protein n=1 Tax=Paracraurococcus ruber TaxID=77675 RepID=A0ABS1D3Y2_9PROT|nr:substrate-binding domain-containing protein [Paracraurococcus ruber]MBK1661176.1 hypothetical protein [Paracraurococcus ruber]TDG29322.1 hypothetical protein E2C05_18160 [Paracraurococcus ruber]
MNSLSRLRVLADIPLQPALPAALARFEAVTGLPVDAGFDPSPTVLARLASGEAADLVIVQPDFLARLAASGQVRAATGPVIGEVGVGLGNRPDSPAHDVSTPAALKAALLGADLIVFNRVASGEVFAGVLERLGIAEALAPRIRRTAPMDIFAPVLAGQGDDILAGTMTLLATAPGIRVLGPLPPPLQRPLTYMAVPMAATPQAEAAARMVEFLASAEARALLAARGVAPG